ncbi:hypothetical protein [Hymenobacter rubidus]|uniref:hypothetical protein n=1 Tax=Hymenobacter rubidus TaxID=1441626 RepID=UPI00191D3E97|nr:hypothetical protein [Hymenobacter rubidus]
MRTSFLVLGAALLLTGCNQTAPVTSAPATTPAPDAAATPAAAQQADSAVAAATAPSADGTAAAPQPAAPTPAASGLQEAETVKASFSFKPAPNSDDPAHPRTSAHLVLQGSKPLDVDLGKFAGKPDVVDAAKAKAANFPAGMLMGFRSYSAATGTSQDLAVLSVDGHRLRIVQRRVEETAPEAGPFETAREIPLPGNTRVVAAPPAKK